MYRMRYISITLVAMYTRWDAGSTTLPAYRFLQAAQGEGP